MSIRLKNGWEMFTTDINYARQFIKNSNDNISILVSIICETMDNLDIWNNEPEEYIHIKIDMPDNTKYILSNLEMFKQTMNQIIEYIESRINSENNGTLVIHCTRGLHRSNFLALLVYYKMGLIDMKNINKNLPIYKLLNKDWQSVLEKFN